MKSFLAPIPLTKPKPSDGGATNVGGVTIGGGGMPMGMNRIDRGGEDKFNKVMDWGTPRLVTKQLVMN